MNSIQDIKHAFYINLLSRTDRKVHVENQFDTLGIKIERFNAIKMTDGALGCSFSHLKLIEKAKAENLDHILVAEDDVLFTQPEVFVNQFNKFLTNHKDFDVVIICGNNCPPYSEIDDTCVKVTRCQTTTCYLVRKHYYDTLINNYREGINKLIREPNNRYNYAIDKYWFNLQMKDNWYLIVPLTVTQREDYSDIEKQVTNYSRAILDLDKEEYFKWQREQMYKASLNKFKI
jgi:GR25 family glycosyltransferase involved in LPS biosynthesis